MEKDKKWIKYVYYFIIGFLIFILLSSITQKNILKELNISMDFNIIIIHTIKDGIILYTILFSLILTLNILYNVKLIKKLNETTQKARKASKEKILNERRKITMKKKILISILIVILIALVLYVLNFVRNVKIIREYSSKLEEYQNLTNFYTKTTNTGINGNNNHSTSEAWKKDNITILKETSNDGSIITSYFDKNKKLILIDDGETKKGFKDIENTEDFDKLAVLEYASYYIEDNLLEDIKAAFTTKISNEIIDGKEYYKFYISDNFQFIVDKETMLKIKEINGSRNMELVDYSIGTLTDEDVKMPNIENYDMQED